MARKFVESRPGVPPRFSLSSPSSFWGYMMDAICLSRSPILVAETVGALVDLTGRGANDRLANPRRPPPLKLASASADK
jgi:hypothetical protein